MAAFIYRCPVTGYNVQAFVAHDRTRGREEDAFESVTCTVDAFIWSMRKPGKLSEIEG